MYDEWEKHLIPLAGSRPGLTLLEIDIGEARSAIWLLDHVLTANDDRYVGIDLWEGARDVEDRARRALGPYGEKTVILKSYLCSVLQRRVRPDLLYPGNIDIAYLDGAPQGPSVWLDSRLIWPLMSVGGVIIWSGYRMTGKRRRDDVAKVVDPFLAARKGKYDVIWAKTQIAVRKTAA